MAIVSTQKGRQAFISNRGIHFLCEINVKQTFQCEDALKLLLNILTIEGKGRTFDDNNVQVLYVCMCLNYGICKLYELKLGVIQCHGQWTTE